MDDGESAVRFLDVVVRRVFLHAQDLVVVFSLAFLQLQLGVSNFLLNAGFRRVGFGDGFVLSYGFVPVPGLAERFRLGLASLGICWVELEGTGAVGDGGFVVFQLSNRDVLVCLGTSIERMETNPYRSHGPILQNLRIRPLVLRIDL